MTRCEAEELSNFPPDFLIYGVSSVLLLNLRNRKVRMTQLDKKERQRFYIGTPI